MSKLNMFFSFLFFLFFSVACSFPQNPNIYAKVYAPRPVEKIITFISPDMDPHDIVKIHNSISAWQYSVGDSGIIEILDPLPGKLSDIDDYISLCTNGNEKLIFIMNSTEEEYVKKINLLFGKILAYTIHLGRYSTCTLETIQFFDIKEINEYHNLDLNVFMVGIHEFGHALGMEHIDNKQSIMHKTYENGLTFLTQYDIEEFCRVYSCTQSEIKKLSYMHISELETNKIKSD